MADRNNDDRFGIYDDFWSISELMPKKKKPLPPPPLAARPAEVTVGENVPPEKNENARISFGTAAEAHPKSVEEYLPEANRLISKVRICRELGGYNFYEHFRRDAVRLLEKEGRECPEVRFFSYIPQYSQLDERQLDYYLYIRRMAREGRAVKCDQSYIFLLIYETINLSGELISPEDGLEMLCSIWKLYGYICPGINQYLATWLCDYCLVYKLDCPDEKLEDLLGVLLNENCFKEFYLGSAVGLSHRSGRALVSLLSDYDWKKSRIAPDNYELFKTHIRGASEWALRQILSVEGVASIVTGRPTVKRWRAFSGSLCSHSLRATVEVEYRSFTDTPELRAEVTGAVKYAENKLRAHLGVRSRLSASPSERVRTAIDSYFARELPPKNKSVQPPPTYEERYTAPSETPSFSDAAEIERLSWGLTRRLVPEGELEENISDPSSDSVSDNIADILTDIVIDVEPETACDAADGIREAAADLSLGPIEREYLTALLAGDSSSARRIASEAHTPVDAIAERINEAAEGPIGDIILIPSEDGYSVVEDYTEDIRKWLDLM